MTATPCACGCGQMVERRPADLEMLPWRRWGVACCPGGMFADVWGDGRGDTVTRCTVCGKRWRHDASD